MGSVLTETGSRPTPCACEGDGVGRCAWDATGETLGWRCESLVVTVMCREPRMCMEGGGMPSSGEGKHVHNVGAHNEHPEHVRSAGPCGGNHHELVHVDEPGSRLRVLQGERGDLQVVRRVLVMPDDRDQRLITSLRARSPATGSLSRSSSNISASGLTEQISRMF